MSHVWFFVLLAGASAIGQTADIYTDSLEDGWQNWSWLGTYTFNNPTPIHSGTASIRCDQQGWGGISFRHDPIASNAYQYLEFYIHGGTTGGQSLDVLLENDTSAPCSGTVNIGEAPAGMWRLVSIRLADLPVSQPTFTRVDIRNRTGNAITYYLDDISLRQTATVPPRLTNLRAAGDRQVVAFFDAGLTVASATNPANYRLQTPSQAATNAQYDHARQRVALTFATNFAVGTRYTLVLNNLTNTAGVAIAPDTTGSFAVSNQTIHINAAAGTHPISPFIYGLAWAPTTNALHQLGVTVHRWGGNHTSTYNWLANAKNTGNDWYFQNEPWQTSVEFTPVSNAVEFVQNNTRAGVASLLTVPMLPFIAKDTTAHSFSVAKYGPQQAVDPYDSDAGNGISTNGQKIVNDPLDSGTTNSVALQSQWLAHLAAHAATPQFVALDNEMDIWDSTHRDWHPAPPTYDEMWRVFTNYATMVRAELPEAAICAPVSCCWWYYWNSAAGDADKQAHSGVDFLEWFLDQARAHELQTGQRLLNVLDIHYYPDSFWNGATNVAQQLSSTRELWDPTYRHEGWIGNDQWATQTQSHPNYPQLIPRFQTLIAQHYPGTRLGLTEYNWGADHTLPGALALADCLGIFGRENLDLACHWTYPGVPGQLAFQLYRNFGNISCQASNAGPDLLTAYAATESDTGALTLMVINKNPDFDCQTTLSFTHFIPAPTGTVWQLSTADLKTLRHEPDATGTIFFFPAHSATLLRFLPADTDGDTLSDLWEQNYFGDITAAAPQADADGDGFTNLQEFCAGTVPTDPVSALKITAIAGHQITFTTVADKHYAIERCDDLAVPGCWGAFTNVPGTGGLITISDPLPVETSRRFYRVRLLP